MKILYSDDELDMLDQVSVYAERLYRHLRRRVDLRTRTVGRGASAISRGMLAINMQYVPPQGSHNPPWKPSPRQIDCLIDELSRAGMAQRCALPAERKKLVLVLPMVLVRPEYERHMSVTDERDMTVSSDSQQPQGFDGVAYGGERDTGVDGERDISLFLCGDEMCAPVGGSNEGPAVDMYEADPPAGSTTWQTTLHAFKQALGSDYRTDTQVFKAIAELRAAADVRAVDASEMVSAIAVARSKSAGSVAGYAAAIIRSGSLCPRPGRVAAAARAKGAPDPVMAYFDDFTGATV